MKQLVIDVNSLILYLSLAIFLAGLAALYGSDKVDGLRTLIYLAGGFVGWCVFSGFWFVQVAILDELKKLNRKGK